MPESGAGKRHPCRPLFTAPVRHCMPVPCGLCAWSHHSGRRRRHPAGSHIHGSLFPMPSTAEVIASSFIAQKVPHGVEFAACEAFYTDPSPSKHGRLYCYQIAAEPVSPVRATGDPARATPPAVTDRFAGAGRLDDHTDQRFSIRHRTALQRGSSESGPRCIPAPR